MDMVINFRMMDCFWIRPVSDFWSILDNAYRHIAYGRLLRAESIVSGRPNVEVANRDATSFIGSGRAGRKDVVRRFVTAKCTDTKRTPDITTDIRGPSKGADRNRTDA